MPANDSSELAGAANDSSELAGPASWESMELPAPDGMTVAEILSRRAEAEPARTAFILVASDGSQETLSYWDLYHLARGVAAALQESVSSGDRVILSLTPGRRYLTALYGCLLAGAIAVPCYPPSSTRRTATLAGIAMDSRATALITDALARDAVVRDLAGTPRPGDLRTILIEEIDETAADHYRQPAIWPHTALLQYTSGSTGAPKGVVIGHDNLLANARSIAEKCGLSRGTIMANWCPPYHDMGLFCGVMGPVIIGFPAVNLSPLDFLFNPRSWLEAISVHRATITAAPNFAYDLTVDRIPEKHREGLDLGSWVCAVSGSEAVRRATLDRFAAAFAPYGFRREAFQPCYGMAEATLLITGGGLGRVPVGQTVDADQLARGTAVAGRPGDPGTRTVVSCGTVASHHSLLVVDPGTLQPLPDGQVGEIWFTGPSVAHGYWRNRAATEATFQATLPTGEGPYLRTGDLGFRQDGEVYIAGRIKDVIIIRGRNHSPDDVEATARGSHPALRPDGVAFAVEVDGVECLAVAHEVNARHLEFDPAEVAAAICSAVATEHDINVHVVVLLPPRSIPKTTSGKKQRAACRARWLTGTLPAVAVWRRPDPGRREAPEDGSGTLALSAGLAAPSAGRIEDWLAERLARSLGTSPRDVDVERPFADFGLDSAEGVRVAADLAVVLGRPLEATLLWDHPTVAKLARHLADRAAD